MKRDLYFSKPLMNAAGSLGFVPDFRSLEDFGSLDGFGAFVTNPISRRPRQPTAEPTVIEYPGGFLLHTGLPNPGIREALKKYSAKWTRSELPIIVHLMADRPEEPQQMVRMLESQENVMAVELGFAPLLSNDIILLTLEMCVGEIPLIFSLPVEQVLSLGPRLMQEGAQAMSIAAPRGALMTHHSSLITGRLYGPSLFPQTLETVKNAVKLGIPIQIVHELLALAGHLDPGNPERIATILDRYVAALSRELVVPGHATDVVPGVPALLDRVEAEATALLGLLTGNVEPGAQLKLSSAAINPARFRVGAYGSDHAARSAPPRHRGGAGSAALRAAAQRP